MSGFVAVDASLGVKWLLAEPYSAEAIALLLEWQDAQLTLVAPLLFSYEVANVFYQRVRRGTMDLEDAVRSARELQEAGPKLTQEPEDSVRAVQIAGDLGLPATYDAQYLAVAERFGCELWTADERLSDAVSSRLSWVRWIGEVSP